MARVAFIFHESVPTNDTGLSNGTITVGASGTFQDIYAAAYTVTGLLTASSPTDQIATNTGTPTKDQPTTMDSGTTPTTTAADELDVAAFGTLGVTASQRSLLIPLYRCSQPRKEMSI